MSGAAPSIPAVMSTRKPWSTIGPVVRVAHDGRLVEHPDDAAVGGDQPVLEPEVLAGRVGALDLGEHALAVVRVHAGRQEVRLQPVADGEAEHRLDLRAHVRRLHRQADGVDVGRERDLLDQRAVLRLRLAEPLLAVAPLRDVVERDGEEHRAGNVDARDRDLGREGAVVGAEGGDLEARAEQRPAAVREHPRQVVPVLLRDRQLEERLAEDVVARPAERLLGRRVHLGDQALVVDDHDAVERCAQDRVLASLAGGERALGALARGDVDHRGDDRDDVAARVADRRRRRAHVDRRAVAVHAAQVEVADHLALRRCGRGWRESGRARPRGRSG